MNALLRAARQLSPRALPLRTLPESVRKPSLHKSSRFYTRTPPTPSAASFPPSPHVRPPGPSLPKPYVHFPRAASPNRRPPRLLLLVVAGCTVYVIYYSDIAPFTSRWRVISLSKAAEIELGKRAYQQLLEAAQPSLLSPSHASTRRARAVVIRLANACNSLDSQLSRGFKWSVAVSHDATPNALCVPGGRILLTTGLMDMCSEEELAMVLSHEIAHAINRHSAEKMQLQMLLYPLFLLLTIIFGSHLLSVSLTKLFLELPFGRKLEREADEVGMILMTEACYDPRKGPSIFDKLAHVTGEQQGGWVSQQMKSIVSTHPMSAERASQLKKKSHELADRYEHRCSVARDWIGKEFSYHE